MRLIDYEALEGEGGLTCGENYGAFCGKSGKSGSAN